MVTTKREIKSKHDRLGAYERNGFGKSVENGGVEQRYLTNEILSVEESVRVKNPVDTRKPTPTATATKGLKVSDAVRASTNRAVAGVQSREKMRTRNIVMVVAYCLVVVALVAVIALNANALTGLATKNAGLEQNIATLAMEQANLNAEISLLSDPTRLANLASSMNLTETSANVVTMSVPKLAPVVDPVVTTNWFDKFCDAISGVFGG